MSNTFRLLDDTTDEEVITKRHSLQFMARPHLWPNGAILPLVRRVPITPQDSFGKELGLLMHEDGLYFFIPDTMLGQRISEEEMKVKAITGRDALLKLITQAGWEVD